MKEREILDIVAAIGFASLVVGFGLAWFPLGLIVGGVLLLGGAVVGHIRRRPEKRGDNNP